MNRKIVIGTIATIFALLAMLFLPVNQPVAAQVFGPRLDVIVWSEQEDRSLALTQIIEGQHDTIIFDITAIADKERAEASDAIDRFSAFGLFDNFLMNPSKQAAGFPQNPFAIDGVRASMQLLIDRDFIVREIWGGFAMAHKSPMWHPRSAEYGRGIADWLPLEEQWAYNPERGAQMMNDALVAAGWSKGTDGLWRDANGVKAVIKGLIRTQDERLQMGAYYAELLRGLGFEVEEIRGPRVAGTAYGEPADQNLWHFYTAGWISTAKPSWEDDNIFFWGCGFGFEPYCAFRPEDTTNPNIYVVNQELADIAETLIFGQYKTLEERRQLVQRGTDLMLQAPIRVFIDARESLFVFNKRFTNYVLDLFGGPSNEWFLKAATVPPDVGGEFDGLRVARVLNLVMFVDGWNPWQEAPGWLYDTVQRRAMIDQPMWLHPHTGRWIDERNRVTVETAGPDGNLSVPSDAILYSTGANKTDASDDGWVQVGTGVNATSKVTVDMVFGKWHHGVDMSMDDVLYVYANGMRRLDGDIAAVPGLTTTIDGSEAFFFTDQLKGIKVVDADTLEVYIDYWHVDPQEIAAVGSVFPSLPWEAAEVAVQTLLDQETANNQEDAGTTARPWLDLTKGDSIPFLEADLGTLSAANYIPPGMSTEITDAEATARWAALNAWYTARGHFWPSQGPFYLETVDIANRQTIMKAFRDGYPFEEDYWDDLTVIKVPQVSFAATPSVVFAGTPANFDFSVSVGPTPTDEFAGSFFLRDLATGEFIDEGVPTRLGAGSYRIGLSAARTDELLLGNFEIISLVVGDFASPPVITRTSFLVLPSTDWFQSLLDARATALQSQLDDLSDDLAKAQSDLSAVSDAAASLTALLTAVTILAVVSIAVAVVSVVLVLRRGRPSGGA